jgi:hypothetical protein
MKKITPLPQEHFREGKIGINTFYSFSKEQKNEYLQSLLELPASQRTTVDDHIIRFHNVLPVTIPEHWLLMEE